MDRIREAFGPENHPFLRTGQVYMEARALHDFWLQLRDPAIRHTYIADLVKYVISNAKSRKVAGVSVEMSLCTLALVVLGLNAVAEHEEFSLALEEVKRRWNRGHAVPNKSADEYVSLLLGIALEGVNEDNFAALVKLSCTCVPLIRKFEDVKRQEYSGEEMRCSASQHLDRRYGLGAVELNPNPRFSVLETGIGCLMHNFAKLNITQRGAVTASALDAYCALLREASVSPSYQGYTHSLLPTLHALNQLLKRAPLADAQCIGQLVVIVDMFRRWPVPYSSAAQRLLETLFQENRAPGVTLVTALRTAFPHIDQLTSSKEDSDSFALASAFLLLDPRDNKDADILSLFEILSHQYFLQVVDRSFHPTESDRISVLAHCLRVQVISYVLKLNLLAELPKLQELSFQDIFTVYGKVVKVFDEVSTLNAKAAKALIEEELSKAMVELEEMSPAPPSRLSQLTSGFFSTQPTLPVQPLEYIALVQADNPQKSIPPSQWFATVFSQLANRAKDPESAYYRRPIKVVAGTDELLHSFVGAYFEHIMQFPEDVEKLEVRVFALPLGEAKCSLAKYLASVDMWYAKCVYVPFARHPFAPRHDHFQSSKQQKTVPVDQTTDLSEAPPPLDSVPAMAALSTLLQEYLQEATQLLPVQIYSVRCWRGSNSALQPDVVLPMALYLEVGYTAAFSRACQLQPDLEGKSPRKALEKNLFRFSPPTLTLVATQVDAAGGQRHEEAKREVRYLCVGNVPRETDCWADADPTIPTLELALLEERAASEESALQRKRVTTKERLSHYLAHLHAQYTNLHVSRVKIVAEAQGSNPDAVDILVDGALYGPYGVVEVCASEAYPGRRIHLPVMTFLDPQP